MKYCVMFAGQSVQETGMCRRLWTLPAARGILERLKPSLGADLEGVSTEMPEAELALTRNAQRAIHAHHLGHWFAYKAAHPDIELDGAVGHSMGIVAALVAAGALSVEDSGRFIRARAEAFAAVCRGFAQPMGLAALATDFLPDFTEKINAVPGVSLALHNTIGRGVAGGTMAALEELQRQARDNGWQLKIRLLKVEGPYHTGAFSSCKEALRRAVEAITIMPPKAPLFMGTSGKRETEPAEIKRLLVEQADSLERHFDAVWAAHDAGCRNFLEVAHKPQPVTWLGDQLQGEDGALMPGVTPFAVRTEEI